jgi:hypothetical protein
VVDRRGGEVDRVGGVSFGPICLAGGKLGIALVGPPVHLGVEVVQLGGGVGLELGSRAAGLVGGGLGVPAGVGGLLVDLGLGLLGTLAELLTGLRHGGVFVAGSLARGMIIDGFRPDRYDLAGAALCLAGVAVIMYARRIS